MMQIVKNIGEMTALSAGWVEAGKTIGFVPTMGVLHEGHLSLVRQARAECDITVASVFVNPLQFGEDDDLDKYPRDSDSDKELLEKDGVDALFTTTKEEMYPEPFITRVTALEEWSDVLCGEARPGHFTGVLTVVAKLLHLTRATHAYFGQKDFQQAMLVSKMVEDLNFPVKVIIGPIVREDDGLALSSRNRHLESEERSQAPIIYEALKVAKTMVENEGVREADAVITSLEQLVMLKGLARIDYLTIVDRATLQVPHKLTGKLAACAAVYFGETRLIDNIYIDVPETNK